MDATISSTSIASPLLSGDWWSPISDLAVLPRGEKMEISFRPEARGPLLIRTGASVDPHSMFFLALFAMRIQAPRHFFTGWMTMAASAGEPSAEHWLGRRLLEEENPESAHWLARSVLEHADGESTVILCWLLWGGPDHFRNEALAHSLLVNEANAGNGAAVIQLGCLYASGCPGIPKNVELGKRLLAIAADGFESAEAAAKLQEIESAPVALDYAIAVGVAAVAVVGGLLLFRRFIRRN
jgi:hypothetical protein